MSKGTTKRMIIMLIIAALLIAGVVGFQTFKAKMIGQAMKAMANPPQTVSTAVAAESSWQPTVEAMGTLRASHEATLSAEVAGLVTALHFDSGASVRAGQALVELDPDVLKAQVEQLRSDAALAALNLKRDEAQLKLQAVSQATVDTDVATLKSKQAQLAAQQALLAQKLVKAPFPGQLGIRQVDLGQYISPGTPMVTLQQLDPMEVDFTVPQSQVDLVHVGMKAQLRTSAVDGKTFTATVTAIEPQIDTSTRNLKVRARVANPRHQLLPGMFATVHVDQGGTRNYITLPNAAVVYNPYGSTVYVVTDAGRDAKGKPKQVVQQRFVVTGATRGDQVAVVSGLKAGEIVVTSGQLKLRNGTQVLVNNAVQPAANPAPQVPNS